MKKLLFVILFAFCYLLFAINANAKDATNSAASDNSADNLNQQINALKSRIASRVAQLKLVEKRGTIGTVTDASYAQITISNHQGNTIFIDVDELTRFSSASTKGTFGISDISKGTALGILGLYNKESRRILARFVNAINMPKVIHGAVKSIDNKNYVLKVMMENNKEISINVETTTKTLSYTKGSGLVKAGFSKIEEGENLIAIGVSDSKNKDEITASKIILLPEIAKNLKAIPPK